MASETSESTTVSGEVSLPEAPGLTEPYLVIDSRGRRCPLPILDLAKAVATAPPGVVIVVLADDPAAKPDLIAWCRMTGAEFVGETGADRFAIRTRLTSTSSESTLS